MSGTMSEILSRFKKDIKNSFQAQKNIVDVTEKYIGLLENAEGGSGGGGIDYSETEQDTGLKWINGSSVYQKTIDLGTLPNSVGMVVNKAHNITNLGLVVSVMCVAYKSGNRICIPTTNANSYLSLMNLNIMDDNVVIMTGSAMKDYHVYITIQYIKSA